jgi:serine/threonine protein kinase
MAFLRALAQGFLRYALKTGANLLSGGVPIAEICVEIWESYERSGKGEKQARADVQQLAASSDTPAQIEQVVRETAGDQPPDLQLALSLYLEQVPGTIRRSLRSQQDPTGRTLPTSLVLRKSADLARFVPDRVPRFRSGDHPVPGTDLVLERLLGTGGFGEVWKALHEDRPEYPPVALKFCTDANAVLSLRNEVRLLDRVATQVRTESGIVQLLHANLRTDPPYLEYEYVEGGDLGGLLLESHRSGTATWKTMTRLMLRLAGIVGVAHQKGIVHRDLKPDNILTRRTKAGPELKIADFGIGGVSAGQDIKRWEKTRMRGVSDGLAGAFTPLYASPQQRGGSPADPRDDVYALGVIWYQALTGDLMREPPTGGGWKKRFIEQGMPAPLVEVLESCIDANPDDRPANAGALAERLTALLGPPSATPPVAQSVPKEKGSASRRDQPGGDNPRRSPSLSDRSQRGEEVPVAALVRESPDAARLKIVLAGLGGDRGSDAITVLFDGRELGKGCAATGFAFECNTRPGNHTVELHGHRKKRFLIVGERQVNQFRTVYPVDLAEPGTYTATFRFGRFVRLAGTTVPNKMLLTQRVEGKTREVSRKTFYSSKYVALLAAFSFFFLAFTGGLLTAILVPSCTSSSRTTAGLSFNPSYISLSAGRSTKVRLHVSRYDARSRTPIHVQLDVPSNLHVPSTELTIESGQDEIEIEVVAGERVGLYTISARVQGQPDAYPATCQVDVTEGGLK